MDYTEVVKKVRPSIGVIFSVVDNQVQGKGTGFVYQKANIMVTCNHVVSEKNGEIFVRFVDDQTLLPAKVVIRDEEHDLALLKFNDPKRVPLGAAPVEKIQEGVSVIFSGFPLTLTELTTHQGILSAIIKDATGLTNYLIDGTVNSGNSGCPLMLENGQVIGVVNAKRRERNDLLEKVEEMKAGAISLHGVDLVEIYDAIIKNVQLGIGYAVPSSYIPKYKEEIETTKPNG